MKNKRLELLFSLTFGSKYFPSFSDPWWSVQRFLMNLLMDGSGGRQKKYDPGWMFIFIQQRCDPRISSNLVIQNLVSNSWVELLRSAMWQIEQLSRWNGSFAYISASSITGGTKRKTFSASWFIVPLPKQMPWKTFTRRQLIIAQESRRLSGSSSESSENVASGKLARSKVQVSLLIWNFNHFLALFHTENYNLRFCVFCCWFLLWF